MKKYFFLLFLLSVVNSYAGPPAQNLNVEKKINAFNSWLSKNGYTQYLEKIETNTCKSAKKFSQIWYYNKCDETKYKNNLDINVYRDRGTEIPHKARPKDDT